MTIEKYLERIGLERRPEPNLAGLRAVHRAHIMSIPYENLDVQMGNPLTISPDEAWTKIVDRGRGGWCYEMNGLLGRALELLGFNVTRMAGAVMREERGDLSLSNHLVLRIDLDEGVYLADVGFGEGSIDPPHLVRGDFYANGFKFTLTEEVGGWWRLHKYLPDVRRSFDFTLDRADESKFALQCTALQKDSESPFVQNLICYRHFDGGYYHLLGRVLKIVESNGDPDKVQVTERLIGDEEDLVTTLKDTFGLDVPAAGKLWPKVAARHEWVMKQKQN